MRWLIVFASFVVFTMATNVTSAQTVDQLDTDYQQGQQFTGGVALAIAGGATATVVGLAWAALEAGIVYGAGTLDSKERLIFGLIVGGGAAALAGGIAMAALVDVPPEEMVLRDETFDAGKLSGGGAFAMAMGGAVTLAMTGFMISDAVSNERVRVTTYLSLAMGLAGVGAGIAMHLVAEGDRSDLRTMPAVMALTSNF